ncbi:MAG: helix-turn-helix transcriptional regulator, partial [Clostridia bacterium]|nr:helix-turn-helix transcriptional regulator [Clostridia bacterium]
MFFYNGQHRSVKRGDVLYIPAGSNYFQECESEELICFHLGISGRVAPEMQILQTDDPDTICRLFERAFECWQQKVQNYEYLCMSVLYEIIARSHATICHDRSDPHTVLAPAMRYLGKHIYDTDLSLQAVCEQSHISRTYFNRLFYDANHCTPVAYINRQRINRAKQFLISGSYTNAEIAYLCGYRDVKYFYVLFKKATGMT